MFGVLFSMLIFKLMLKVGTFSVPYNLPRKNHSSSLTLNFLLRSNQDNRLGIEDHINQKLLET